LSQVRDCVPQLPQDCVDGPMHVCPLHASHWHAGVQACVPPVPQACTVSGAQTPSPLHVPHADHAPLLHVRDCVPQLPQGCVVGPSHVWPVQRSHWQVSAHVCVPPVPHARVAAGVQRPSFRQVPHADHVPLLHVRVCVPQLPHPWEAGPTQVWPLQRSHWQVLAHACVPPLPHACVADGVQTPSLKQSPHADHVPLSHVRVWVPQLPHA
jgi:hypothetical protein